MQNLRQFWLPPVPESNQLPRGRNAKMEKTISQFSPDWYARIGCSDWPRLAIRGSKIEFLCRSCAPYPLGAYSAPRPQLHILAPGAPRPDIVNSRRSCQKLAPLLFTKEKEQFAIQGNRNYYAALAKATMESMRHHFHRTWRRVNKRIRFHESNELANITE